MFALSELNNVYAYLRIKPVNAAALLERAMALERPARLDRCATTIKIKEASQLKLLDIGSLVMSSPALMLSIAEATC